MNKKFEVTQELYKELHLLITTEFTVKIGLAGGTMWDCLEVLLDIAAKGLASQAAFTGADLDAATKVCTDYFVRRAKDAEPFMATKLRESLAQSGALH